MSALDLSQYPNTSDVREELLDHFLGTTQFVGLPIEAKRQIAEIVWAHDPCLAGCRAEAKARGIAPSRDPAAVTRLINLLDGELTREELQRVEAWELRLVYQLLHRWRAMTAGEMSRRARRAHASGHGTVGVGDSRASRSDAAAPESRAARVARSAQGVVSPQPHAAPAAASAAPAAAPAGAAAGGKQRRIAAPTLVGNAQCVLCGRETEALVAVRPGAKLSGKAPYACLIGQKCAHCKASLDAVVVMEARRPGKNSRFYEKPGSPRWVA